jgi:hypothetical protein
MIFLLLVLTTFTTLKGPKRPKKVFFVTSRRGKQDIKMLSFKRGPSKFFTKDSKTETALQCVGKNLIYIANNKLYRQNINKPGKEIKIGSIPKELGMFFNGRLRHFIKISSDNKSVLWPGNVSIKVKTFGKKGIFKIATPPGKSIVHPSSWRKGKNEIFYVTHTPATGKLIFHFRELGKNKDRLKIAPLGKKINSVKAFETHWSIDGKWLAVNLDIEFKRKKKMITRRFFVIMKAKTGKIVKLKKGWRIKKFHGFTLKNQVVLSGKVGRKTAIYYMTLSPKLKIKRVEKLFGRKVYGYFQNLNITLLQSKYNKCSKKKIYKVTKHGAVKKLLRWAKWVEILAYDRDRTWGLFRSGGACRTTRPSLDLMRMDGSLLLKELSKRKFKPLRLLSPEQVTICR